MMKTLAELDHYEVLEVSRDARREELERAFALVRGAYEGDALAAYSVIPPDEAKLWRERIDEAWRVLSDPDTRRAYDASLDAAAALVEVDPFAELAASPSFVSESAESLDSAFADGTREAGEPPALPEAPNALPSVTRAQPVAPLRVEEPPPVERSLPRELAAFDEDGDPETGDWDGPRLRRARLLRGLEIEDVARATKINPTYLRFLEEERFDDLPAAVYVRGFVASFARLLGLDAVRVAQGYVARCEEHRSARPRGRFLGRR